MDTGDSSPTTRRRLLKAIPAVGAASVAGCVTTGLSLRTDGVDGSGVFESVSLSESWTASVATASVTLTEAATVDSDVRELAVVDGTGTDVWTDTVEPTQTSVSGARFPVGETATLAAADNSGAFVERVSVTVSGSSVP